MSTSRRRSGMGSVALAAGILLCFAVGAGVRPPAQANGPVPTMCPTLTMRQRMGVGLVTSGPDRAFPGDLTDYLGVEALGAGWYLDWGLSVAPEHPAGMEYFQTLDLEPWRDGFPSAAYLSYLRQIAEANPGATWIVGNEPDHHGQGNCTPEEYAHIYRRAYVIIKCLDPTAQVAIGGVVMPSPLRLLWLEHCLAAYRAAYGTEMPVDVWNTHMQLLRENWWDERDTRNDDPPCAEVGQWGSGCPVGLDPFDPQVRTLALSDLTSCDNADPALFQSLLLGLRAWLVEHGQADKPLIISEMGVLMPDCWLTGGALDVETFMEATFAYMCVARDETLGYSGDGGRLVQRWLWFSLNGPLAEPQDGGWADGYNGSLYDWRNPDTLTRFGFLYRRLATTWAISRPYTVPLPLIRIPDG